MTKQHAIHNEAACDFLLSGNQFNDWVVTTAFYAALHYVQHEIFPLSEGGNTYADFNVYFGKVLKQRNQRLNKHSATLQLVGTRLPGCLPYYRWLYDACMTARYTNYKVSAGKARLAKSYLDQLKGHLSK
jgi:hypothetical protein